MARTGLRRRLDRLEREREARTRELDAELRKLWDLPTPTLTPEELRALITPWEGKTDVGETTARAA